MRFFLVLFVFVMISHVNVRSAKAQSRSEIACFNIVGTGLVSAFASVILGKIDNAKDFLKVLGVGAAGGLTFLTAKTLIAEGQVEAGVALSFLSSSVVENVTIGEHPLSFLRYGVGPLELRISTGLSRRPRSHIALEADLAEVPLFLYFLHKADRIQFRDGILTGIVDDSTIDVFGFKAGGVSPGRTVLLARPSFGDQQLWRHEVIHVSQDIQFGTWLVRARLFKQSSKTNSRPKKFTFGYRFGWVLLSRIMVDEAWNHADRWVEVEARTLAD